ncbi:MAG: hypothetical protein IJQ87_02580 [Clostridia bacterium]|nr:hypothetical protein [Clostridia bacterium]
MENKVKAETFIGFAIRARKIRFGFNTLATLKKAFVILVCSTAAENTVKAAIKYAAKYKCRVFSTATKTLSELSHKDGVKIAAITDFSLAKAVIESAGEDLAEITGSSD